MATEKFPIQWRAEQDLRDALREAAKDDGRSLASYVDKVLRDHLQQKGYLPGPDSPRPAPRKRKAGDDK